MSCTVRNGIAHFNQVVLENEDPPESVILVAVEPARGLFIWEAPFIALFEHSTPQHPGYSRSIPEFPLHSPPRYLGEPEFDPREAYGDGWDRLVVARTNTLNRKLREYLGV